MVQYIDPNLSVFQHTCLNIFFNVQLNFSMRLLQIGRYGVFTNCFKDSSLHIFFMTIDKN